MRGKLALSILFAGLLVSGIAWGTAFYNLCVFLEAVVLRKRWQEHPVCDRIPPTACELEHSHP